MREYLAPFRSALQDGWLRAILLTALILALAYNFTIAMGYGPDEGRHKNYVELLVNERRLPEILEGRPGFPYKEYKDAHAFHPPLYYTILAPFYMILGGLGEAKWHVLRFVSTLLCLATIPMIFALAMRVVADKSVARVAAGTVALLPMFGMTAATINNDSGALFFTVLFLYFLAAPESAEPNMRRAILLGVVMGLGGLCKATVLLCDGLALLAAPFIASGTKARSAAWWTQTAIALVVGLVLVSPWHIRSFNLYGKWNPLPTPAYWFNPPLSPLLTMAHPDFPRIFGVSNWGIFYTLWGQRDWLRQVEAPAFVQPPPLQSFQFGVYLVITLACLIGIVGFILSRRGRGRTTEAAPRLALWTPILAFVASWVVVLQVALFMHQGWAEGGRYLIPAFCGLSIPLALGWRHIFKTAYKFFAGGWLIWLVTLNLVSLHWLITYLNPKYVH